MLKRLTIKRLWLLTLIGSLSVVAVIAHVAGITSLLNVNNGNVAKIGSTEYATLSAAIAAVPDGTPTTITMIADETVADGSPLTIAATKNIVLDLNGKTVTGSSSNASFYFITNNGTLEITDNSQNSDGKISYRCSSPDNGYSKECVTIYNLGGTLTLTKGIIENTTQGGLAYAINNSSNAWGESVVSTFNMTGGSVSAPSGDASLRVYQNTGISWKVYSTNHVTISGGTIEAPGIFVDTYLYTKNQDATNYAANDITKGAVIDTKVNISGGTVIGLIDMKIRHPFFTELNITGGDFQNSKLWVRKYAAEYGKELTAGTIAEPTKPMVNISGGKFSFTDGKAFGLAHNYGNSSWTSYTKPYYVSGGVFNVNLNTFSGIEFPEDKTGVSNMDSSTKANYPYTVGVVAQIGETTYKTLADAIADANASGNCTITLLADIDFSQSPYDAYKWAGSTYNPLEITSNNITIDLNGKTISNMGNTAIALGHLLAKDGRISNVTIKNGTLIAGKTDGVTNSYVFAIAGVDGALVENVTTTGGINVCTGSKDVVIKDCNVTGTKYYTVCSQTGSEVTIKGTTYTKNTDNTVANKSMFWIQGAGTDSDMVTSENATGAFDASSITLESGNFTVDTTNGGQFFLTSGVKPSVKGGTFNIDPTSCVAEGFAAAQVGSLWKVGEVVAGNLTPSGSPTEIQATYQVTPKVMDGETQLGTLTPTTVTVAITDNNNVAEGATLSNLNMEKVVTKALTEAPSNASAINVEIAVVATPETPTVENTLVFEVHPEAIISVNQGTPTNVELTNEDLAQNATFTFKLDVSALSLANGSQVKVVHKSSDPATYPDETFYATVADGKVSITVSHFSQFELTPQAVAQIGDDKYETLDAAFSAATNGQTITLLTDVELGNTEIAISDGRSITLDMNGKNIVKTGTNSAFFVGHGTLNIVGEGTISGTPSNYKLIYLKGATTDVADYSNLTIGENVTVTCTNGYAVMISANSNHAYGVNVTVNGTVQGQYGGLYINGSIQDVSGNVPNFTVNSTATVKNLSTDYSAKNGFYAIYAAGYANWTINGGSIYGGMELKSGTLDVSGGTFTGLGEVAHTPQGSNTSTSGYALSVVNNSGYAGYPAVRVTDGTFNGPVAINDDDNDTSNNTADVAVSGGQFSVVVPEDCCADGYVPVTTADPTTGMYTVEPKKVAEVGGVQYTTLQEAIAAATNGATVTLLEDIVLTKDVHVTTSGENIYCVMVGGSYQYQVAAKQLSSLTIDGDGHTITMGTDAAFGSKYRLQGGCAFFFGKYGDTGEVEGTYTLKNITFKGFNTQIIRPAFSTVNLVNCTFDDNHITEYYNGNTNDGTNMIYAYQGALNVDGCTFTNNTISAEKYGLIFSNNSNTAATITINNNLFKNNGTAQAPTGGNGLIYLSNAASSEDAITNNTFEGNYVQNTSGNAAVVYLSNPVETFSGNLFKDNHVNVTSSGKKEGVIVLGSNATGTPVVSNAFVGNVLDSDAPTKRATIVVSCNSDLSNNYWGDGEAAEVGTGKDIYNDGNITNTGFATTYTANAEPNYGVTVTVPVAQIVNVQYTSLAEAIEAVEDGQTITLLTNVELDNAVDIDNSITLNLDGKTISISAANEDGYAISVSSGTVTITGDGTIDVDDNVALLVDGGAVTIENGTFVGTVGVDNGSLTINDGSFGTLTTNDGTTTVNGGTFSETVQGYGGNLVINNGTFTANDENVLHAMSGGTITVNGGSFTATKSGDDWPIVAWAEAGSIVIKGGTFTGGENSVLGVSDTEGSSIEVSGGLFSSVVPTDYCATGYVPTTEPDGNGKYTVVPPTYVAQIGDVKYETLAEAIEAAESGATIEIIADVTELAASGGEIEINKPLTITGAVDSDGNPLYTIYGKSDAAVNAYHDIFVASANGTVTISNVKFANFKNARGSKNGEAPILVSSGNKKVVIYNIHISAINCEGIHINGGEFTIQNSYIDCAKENGFTRGVQITNAAHGSIINTTILNTSGSETVYTAAVEAIGSGEINITDCTFTMTANNSAGIATSTAEGSDAGTSTINVSGCTITANNPIFNDSSEGAEINVSSGSYTGELSDSGNLVAIAISGGTFNHPVPEGYCAEGYIPTEQDPETGLYSVTQGSYVAQITVGETTTKYETLQAALDAAVTASMAANGAEITVTVLTDVANGTGLALFNNAKGTYPAANGANVKIDFGGYTYTVAGPAVGSSNTQNQVLHFESGNTITLTNGTINMTDDDTALAGFEIFMQNYGTLIIDEMTIDGTGIAIAHYGNTFTGDWAVFNGTEKPQFNYNTAGSSVIRNSTITMPGALGIDDAAALTIEDDAVINVSAIATKGTDDRYSSATATVTVENGAKFTLTDAEKVAAFETLLNTKGQSLGTAVEGVYTVEAAKVAQIGDVKYASLAEAIAASETGDEIVMIANSEETLYVADEVKNKELEISGAYTLTSPSGNFGFYFGDYDGGNRPTTDKLNVSGITMTKSGGNYTTLFDGVTADLTNVTVNGDGNTALSYANGAVGTLTNVTVTNTGNHSQTWRNTALALQGIGAGPSVVTVKSGSYSSTNGYAVYMFSSGGTVNIEGGTFSGALMAQIDNNSYPGNQAIINISGGTFTNCTLTESGGDNAQINISGGYFSVDPTDYLVPGYSVETLTSSATGDDLAAYNAGAIYKVDTRKVAQIGDVKYETLEAAVAAATDGQTIELLDNCSGSGLFIGPNKFPTSLTIDFKTFTYTVNTPVGSTGTVNQALHFEQGNKITLTNGTIDMTDDDTALDAFEMFMQNYGTLIIDGMDLDGTGIAVETYSDPKYQAYPEWYETEKPQFNYNTAGNSVIRNSTITMPGALGIDDAAALTIEDDAAINVSAIATKGTDDRYSSATATVTVENGAKFALTDPNNVSAFEALLNTKGQTLGTAVGGSYTVTTATTVADIILIDGEPYAPTSDMTVTHSITYRRSFESYRIGVYQPWFVPFDYTIKSADLDKFDFYKINVISNSKNEGDSYSTSTEVWVHIYPLTAGTVLHANKPYVIKAKKDAYVADTPYNFVSQKSGENLKLKGRATTYVHHLNSGLGDFQFYGTYEETRRSDINAMTGQVPEYFWYLDSEGKLSWGSTAFPYSLPSYRWFFILISEANYAPSFGFIEDSSEATDLNGIEFASDEEIEGYYTLNGVKVQTPSKGVYIVRYNNGMTKKINIK